MNKSINVGSAQVTHVRKTQMYLVFRSLNRNFAARKKSCVRDTSMMKRVLNIIFLLIMCRVMQAQDYVGTTMGGLSTSPTGGATYTIPLQLRDGYSSFTPQISLVYDSQSGNGIAGFGWNISGLSSIAAIPHSRYYDGSNIKGIALNAGDAYALDGERLLLKSGSNARKGAEYTTEEERFYKITIDSAFASTPKSFVVRKPDGTTYKYGSTSSSIFRHGTSTSTIACGWLLDYAADKDGNCIRYIYAYYNNVPYLTQIQYGINQSACTSYCRVLFNYENRGDTIVSHVKGKKFCTTRRLSSIVCEYYGTIYRKYQLAYNNNSHYSHLVSVKETGSDGKGYPATTFTWKNLPGTQFQTQSVTVVSELYRPEVFNYYTAADVDNDGKAELICVYPRNDGYSQVNIYRKEENHFNIRESFNIDGSYDIGDSFFNYVTAGITAHFGNNQANTLVVPMFSSDGGENTYAKFRFVKEGWQYSSPLKSTTEMPSYAIADFDKDGHDAIIYVEKKKLNDGKIRLVTINLNTAVNDASENEQYLQPASLTSAQKNDRIEGCLAADFDGDGLTDLMVECKNYCIVLWNNNGAFSASSCNVLTGIRHGDTFQPADFNGDGLIDLVINEPSSTTWKRAINNGTKNAALFSVYNLSALSSKGMKRQSDEDSIYCCMPQDFNADGLSDLMVSYVSGGNQKICWFKAERNGTFTSVKEATLPMSSSVKTQNIALGDFDGDGYAETVAYGGDLNNGGNVNKHWRNYKNSTYAISCNKITSIKDGIGKVTNLTYRSLLDSYANSENVTFPLMKFYAPLAVLGASSDVWKGTQYQATYSYGGGIMHVQGKGFLGFKEQSAEANGLRHVKTIGTNTAYYAPYIASEKVTDLSGAILRSHHYEYNFVAGDVSKSYHKYLGKEQEGDNANYTSSTVFYTNYLPANGQPREVETQSAGTSTSTYTYGRKTQNGYYILGIPKWIETHHTARGYNDQDDHFYEKAYWSYDEKIRPVKKENYRSDTEGVWNITDGTYYQYDNGGKATKVGTLAYNSTDTLTTSYTYDSRGRLIRKVLPDGHGTTYAYNSLGLLSAETDEWFSTQQLYTYDGMGRLIRTIKKSQANAFTPDTTFVSFALGNDASYAYKVTTSASHQPTTIAYHDGFGREVRSGSIHFDGREYVADKTYINANVVGFESVPHLVGTSTSAGTTYEYDSFFRPTLVTGPTGETVETTYLDMGKEVTENGVTTYYEYDAGGKLTTRTDDKGDIFYYYKATGEYDKIQLSYMDNPDVFATYTYDKYGRLVQLITPNGDSREYVYDDSGFLQKFSQRAGKYEIYTYNKYGDITQRTFRPKIGSYGTASYTYDSKRQLISVSSSKYNETYTYNASGLLTNKMRRVSVDGHTRRKTTAYTYAGESQIMTMTSTLSGVSFPIVESYTYKRGWMTDIKLNNRPVWHLGSENASGFTASTSNRLGTTSYTYDSSGRIKKSSTAAYSISAGGKVTFQHNYTYDPYGRMVTKDGKQYGYDDYNQLISWNGRSYSYDKRGNITMNGGQAEIVYNNYKLSAISSPKPDIWGLGSLSVSYDGKNLPYKIAFTPRNTNVGYETDLLYDAEGNRISALKTKFVTTKTISADGHSNTATTSTNEFLRFYIDSRYEVSGQLSDSSTFIHPTHYYYVGGDPLTACAVAQIENNNLKLWQIYRDGQGSITEMADSVDVNRYYYDPWGRYCDAAGNMPGSKYAKGGNAGNPFYRGYLGQEHLLEYGVINLNARLYDPFIGRFLSADPVYDSSRSIFGFNPYIYGNNCPSMYVDPDGDFPWIIVGAALIGGGINLYANRDHVENLWQGLSYFGVGAAGGGAAMAFPEAAFWINGGVTMANSALSQGFADGWDTINWGHVAFEGIVSMGIERFTGPLQQNISNWIGGYTSRLTHSTLFNRWINKIFASTTTNGMIEGALSVVEKKPILKGVKHGVEKGFYKGTIQWAISDLPMQKHHFATNKHSEFTPAMENIAKKYGLNLDDDWNIAVMPHLGRHPSSYNNWVLNRMRLIDKMPGMNQQRFLEEFDIRIKQPIIDNPEMLRKAWW